MSLRSLATRSMLRRSTLRHLSTEGWHLSPEAGPSVEVLDAVHTIMQEKAACPADAVETTCLKSDLGLKFKASALGPPRRALRWRGGGWGARLHPAAPSLSLTCPPARRAIPQVLRACERHFSVAIPHRALVELVDARTVAAYVDGALHAQEVAEKRVAEHWSKTLPSNVNLVGFTKKHEARNINLAELLVLPEQGDKIWNPANRAAKYTDKYAKSW
jgi:hypothetical protein